MVARVRPPIIIPGSGLRKEELLLHPVESVELLRNRLAKVENNRLFLMTMNLA